MPNILANSSLYSPINLASCCFYLTATIFSLKLLWNILLPFAMVIQATNQPDQTSRKGISLTLEVDLALWLFFVSPTHGTSVSWDSKRFYLLQSGAP